MSINGDINTDFTIIGVTASSQANDTSISLSPNPIRPGSSTILIKKFTVVGVLFGQESACSGFDNVETPNPYLMVPQNGNNKFKATVIPSGASGNFRLAGLEQNGVSASPATLTSGEQIITVTAGNNLGTFTLQALGTNATEPAAVLKIAVRKRIEKTVSIHAISEENDDVQGTKSICVTSGNNGVLDTIPNVNDVILTDAATNLKYIGAGSDRRCDTVANHTNTPADPANIPSATALETALNDTYWGKQANVHFTVTRGQDYVVNYDLDLDGKISSESPGHEPQDIEFAAQDTSKDYNLYYLGLGIHDVVSNGTTKHPLAFGDPNNYANTFFGPPGVGNGTIIYLASHEIGHLLEKTFEHSLLMEDLMYGEALNTNPCRIRKRDWDLINLSNPQN